MDLPVAFNFPTIAGGARHSPMRVLITEAPLHRPAHRRTLHDRRAVLRAEQGPHL